MTSDEFDTLLKRIGIGTGEAASEMRALSGGKTSTSYVSAMRNGRKEVSQAAAIYANMKLREVECSPAERDVDIPAELRRLANQIECQLNTSEGHTQ